jgi:putative spermidine/putrescine transport system substrate-binding protein
LPPDPLQRPGKNGKVPQELIDALPPAAATKRPSSRRSRSRNAGKAAITTKWDSVVGANVQ